MGCVPVQLQVFESEIVYLRNGRVDFQIRERIGHDCFELLQTFDVIVVDVEVCKHVHELAALQACHLGD